MNREEAFNFLCLIAEGAAAMFGSNCEALIHDMSGDCIVTTAIYNGHVSGRKIGSTYSIFGNDTRDSDSSDVDLDKNYINKLVVLPSGNIVKSSTFHLLGENYHFALGFNLDITVMDQMRRVLDNLTAVEGELRESITRSEEPQIEFMVQTCLAMVNKPVDQMKKADRIAVVRLLKDRNAFNIQRSVPYIADRLKISKYSIYKYLSEIGV